MAAEDADLVAGAEQYLAELADDEAAMALIPVLMRLDVLLRQAKGMTMPESTRRLLEQIHDEMAATAAILEGDSE